MTRPEYATIRPPTCPGLHVAWARSTIRTARVTILALVILSGFSFRAPMTEAANAAVDDAISTEINTAVNFDALANDPNGLSLVEHTSVNHGDLTSDASGGFEYMPHANFLGTDGFRYTVEDRDGTRTSGSVAIEVTGEIAGVEARGDKVTTNEDTEVWIAVRANDGAGPDNLPLTVSIDKMPEKGESALQADGSIVYTPPTNWSGLDELRYSISDGVTSDTATVSIDVASVADLPNAVDDAVLTDEGQPVEIEILANDSEADGDEFVFVEHSPALYGTVSWSNADGMITYEPNAGFFGVDSFTYSIADIDGADSGAVTISVDGRPAAGDDVANAQGGIPVMVNVLADDADPEAQPLTVTSVTKPKHGEASVAPDFSIRYVAKSAYTGVDTFSYSVADPRGNAVSATVTINIVPAGNLAPTAADDEYILDEDSPGNTLDVLTNDTDPDSQPLTIAIDRSPEFGYVTVGASQVVTYTPNPDFSGTDSFVYSVSDGNAGVDSATVSIIVQPVNDLPSAQPDTFAVIEDAETVLAVLVNDTDPDGDAMIVDSIDDPPFGTATINQHGELVYQPDDEFSGPDSFAYTLSDERGGTATALVTVSVSAVNDVPRANDDQTTTGINAPVNIDVLANDGDPDHSSLGVAIESAPEHGSATVGPGNTVQYAPNALFEGIDRLTYVAIDGLGASDVATVVIIIGDPDLDPVAVKDDARTSLDTDIRIAVLDNDISPIESRLTVSDTSEPAHGAVKISKGTTIVYTPDDGFIGKDSFTYTVSDADGRTDKVRVYINVRAANE